MMKLVQHEYGRHGSGAVKFREVGDFFLSAEDDGSVAGVVPIEVMGRNACAKGSLANLARP